MNENEEIMEAAEEAFAEPSREQELTERIRYLSEENECLKEELFCLKEGIPQELSREILGMARLRSESSDITFEEAAREIMGRLSGFVNVPRRVSTGVRTASSGGGEDMLRKAFGLK